MGAYEEQLQAVGNRFDSDYLKVTADLLPETVRQVYLVGCGATLSQMYPLQYLLDRCLTGAAVRICNAAEFAARRPEGVGSDSVVLGSSHSGSTAETVASLQYAQSRGAAVFSISSKADSPLSKNSDAAFVYPDGPGLSEAKLMLGWALGTELLRHSKLYGTLRETFAALPAAFAAARDYSEGNADQWVEPLLGAETVFSLGSGPTFGPAYAFAICKLMEMQWIQAAPLKTLEMFHGPLEVTDQDVPYVVFVGEDETREYALRVIKFLRRYSQRVVVVDAAAMNLPLPAAGRFAASSLALWPAINTMTAKLAAKTGHSLDLRRYMGVVKY